LDDIPIIAQALVLAILLLASGFFAMAETAMMACNRYRLRALADSGSHGARLALALLAQTDKLLGVILLFNTLINAAIAALAGFIAVHLFGDEKWVLGVGTLLISFLILIFAEITPKVIGASHADKLATGSAYALTPILKVSNPIVSLINLLVAVMLQVLHLRGSGHSEGLPLSPDELKALVIESGHIIPKQHRDILVNLFDLEQVTVQDMMIPRGEIELVDIRKPIEELRLQLATSYHSRLPVVEGGLDNVLGILHQRQVLAPALLETVDQEAIRARLIAPYYIPAATAAYAQLQFFRETHQHVGLVVDEYGEIQGLITLEDIIEEIVGKFSPGVSGAIANSAWRTNGYAMVDGSQTLRDINRSLGLDLPLDGPKTLSGLIVEQLRDIPEADVCLRIAGIEMETVQIQDRRIKMVKLFRPQKAE